MKWAPDNWVNRHVLIDRSPGPPERAARSSPSAAEPTTSPEGKRQEEEEQSSPPTEEQARHQEETRECHGISLPPVEPRRRTEDASPEGPGGRGSRSDPIPLCFPRAEEDRSDETLRREESMLGARREGGLPPWRDQSHQGRCRQRRLAWRRGV